LLIPTRIVLRPDDVAKSDYRYVEASREILGRIGTNKFSGNAADHAAPRFADKAYGPELAVTGIVINGSRVDLARREANFFDLTVSSEVGSCPYLLSWDEADRAWIEHGKVLHKAQGKSREYTETVTLPGFRPRFRLEEREAEVAFIDQAELTVALVSGDTLTLTPDDPRLGARDGDRLPLLWGDAAELEFRLPEGMVAGDVVESRLVVTGFYERYASLMAAAGGRSPANPMSRQSRDVLTSPTLQQAVACPVSDLTSSTAGSWRR
jgi:hypothetical protein